MRSQHLSLKAYTLLLEKRQVYFLGLYFWVSLIAHLIKNLPAMQETPVQFLGQEDSLEKGQATHSSILGLPFDSSGKESTCNVGDLDLIPELGRYPGEGKGYPLQYSGLKNSMDCIVHGVTKSRTRLSDFGFHFTFAVQHRKLYSISCDKP